MWETPLRLDQKTENEPASDSLGATMQLNMDHMLKEQRRLKPNVAGNHLPGRLARAKTKHNSFNYPGRGGARAQNPLESAIMMPSRMDEGPENLRRPQERSKFHDEAERSANANAGASEDRAIVPRARAAIRG